MPKYIVLYRLTDQGRRNMRDIIAGAEETQRHHEALGFKVLGTFWTLGAYDFIGIVEAPSDQEMMAGMLNIAEAGNVTSESLRAFDREEMKKVLESPNKGSSAHRPQRLPRTRRRPSS